MIVAGFDTAADGIAREMALLEQGRPATLLWQSAAPALVLPAAVMRKPQMQAAAAEAQSAGWPVVTRHSGGGIVPQGPWTLNLAMILPAGGGVRLEDGYRLICGAVIEALARFDVRADTGARAQTFCDGAWNVLVAGRKIAGTAQRWRGTPDGPVVLAHAALLMAPPDDALWPVIDRLQRTAFSAAEGVDATAHVALSDLIGTWSTPDRFPGALARAAEDRLIQFTTREHKAA